MNPRNQKLCIISKAALCRRAVGLGSGSLVAQVVKCEVESLTVFYLETLGSRLHGCGIGKFHVYNGSMQSLVIRQESGLKAVPAHQPRPYVGPVTTPTIDIIFPTGSCATRPTKYTTRESRGGETTPARHN